MLSVTVFNKNKDLLNTQNQATYNHLLQQTQEEIDNKLFISRNLMLQLKSNNALWQYVQSDFNQSKNITSIALELRNEMALFPNMGITISLTKFGSDIILSPGTTSNVEQFRAVMGFDAVSYTHLDVYKRQGQRGP